MAIIIALGMAVVSPGLPLQPSRIVLGAWIANGKDPPPEEVQLVMKTVANLRINLSRFGKVRAAERVAIVQQESLVR